jgi:hypothetical protein
LSDAAWEGELEPIVLSYKYLKGTGETARRRVVVAGLRLAHLLGSLEVSSASKP